MKAKLGNFSPSTLIGTGLFFSSVALVSGGVLSYSARTHQFYSSPAQGLPRTTERHARECGDEPRTSGVEQAPFLQSEETGQGERLVRGECSESRSETFGGAENSGIEDFSDRGELPRRAAPQSRTTSRTVATNRVQGKKVVRDQSHGRKSVVRGLPESENGGRLWQTTGADGVVIPFSTLTRGLYSGVRQPMQIGIRTQEQWVALWKQHSSIEANPSPPAHVDFASEMVVGLFLGERSTGGYEVEITRAEQAGSNLRLYYHEKSPPRGAIVTQALIQPYHLIKLPKHDLDPVFFREGS